MKKIIPILFLISLSAFSISFEKIGEWGFGKYQGIAMKDNIVYGISRETGISIVDFSDINNPVKIGEFSRNEEFHSIFIDGDIAYISALGKIYITDISGDYIPKTISVITADADFYSIFKFGNYLYVSAGYAGFKIYDISDISAPSEIGGYLDSENMVSIVDIKVDDNYIYVIDKEAGLFIYSTYDFQTYEEVGRMRAAMNKIELMDNNQLAISFGGGGIKFYDAENPDSLKYLGAYTTVNFIADFVIDGTIMYCADSYNGLLILDITSTATPELVKLVSTPTICYALVKKDNVVYTANSTGGIMTFDVSTPAESYVVSRFADSSYPLGMTMVNGYMLVADFYNGIKSLSTDDLTSMQLLDLKRGIGFPAALTRVDNYIYYADTTNGIGILKLNEDGSLTDINYLNYDGNFLDIDSYENYLCVSGEYGGLLVFDISDRETPVLIGRYYESMSIVNVQIDDNGVMAISMGFNGVKLCKIENGELIELSWYFFDGYVIDAAYDSGNLYVADFYNGLTHLKLSENFEIVSEQHYLSFDTPETIYLSGSYLYIACGSNGVYVFKTGTYGLEQQYYFETFSNAKRLMVEGDKLFIAEGLSGKVTIYRIIDGDTKTITIPNIKDSILTVNSYSENGDTVEVVIYRNLNPVEWHKFNIKIGESVSLNIKEGDTVKCFYGDKNTEFALSPEQNGLFIPLSVKEIVDCEMYGFILPDSFSQTVYITNLSGLDGFFYYAAKNSKTGEIKTGRVFLENNTTKRLNLNLNENFSVEIYGKFSFSAIMYQHTSIGVMVNYMKPKKSKKY